MAQPTITQIVQRIEVDNVGAVALTPISQDVDQNFVREFRIAGFIDADNQTAPVVFVLRLSANNASAITLTTPQLSI